MRIENKPIKEFLANLEKENLINFSKVNIDVNTLIKNINYNSQKITSNSIFICKGLNFKNEYILDAIHNRTILIIFDEKNKNEILDYLDKEKIDISYIVVRNINSTIGIIAKTFYGDLSKKIKIIGLTGTKGKTTTTYMINNIFDKANKKIAMLSSMYTFDGKISEEANLTTPDILELYEFILSSINNGCEYLVMEVSSQGLKLGRVQGIDFFIGVLLNIGSDHISEIEHPNVEDYQNSKLLLAEQSKTFLFNLDMKNADSILKKIQDKSKNIKTFSIKEDNNLMLPDFQLKNIKKEDLGFSFDFEVNSEANVKNSNQIDKEIPKIYLPLWGIFNIENAMTSIVVSELIGIDSKYIKEGLNGVKIPGRMEIYRHQDKTIIIDYAHNKMSFDALFKTVKNDFPDSEISIIFGTPGGKALNRRIELAESSAEFADRIYLTEEDANFEDPKKIGEEIKSNILKSKDKFQNGKTPFLDVISDRKTAIESAIKNAKKNAVILITGKGHETTLKRQGKYVPYPTDVEIVGKLKSK